MDTMEGHKVKSDVDLCKLCMMLKVLSDGCVCDRHYHLQHLSSIDVPCEKYERNRQGTCMERTETM